jgi:adenine-specific DNA-methyltransferase
LHHKGEHKTKEIVDTDNLIIKGNNLLVLKLSTVWSHAEIPKADLANEGGVELKRGKKPEQLLARIIEMTTNKGDCVLDFFLGSGTTAAVSHKMGRRYIGIEQLDYGENDSIKRLGNVIDGVLE